MNPELFTLGVGALALMVAWKFILRPTLQDTFKDRLFDVRDELRRRFAQERQLHTPAYREVRDTINRYIRFVEEASFTLTFGFSVQIEQNPELARQSFEELDRRYDVGLPELSQAAKEARAKCIRLIHFYVFHSSFYSLLMVYCLLFPAAVVVAAGMAVRSRFARNWRAFRQSMRAYMRRREDETIVPRNTELLSQITSLL